MKNMITVFVALFSIAALAHDIQGTLILKGSLKKKITVDGKAVTCKIKVGKVKNLLLEDSYGNPAYSVALEVGVDDEVAPYMVHNLFATVDGSEVRDLEYGSNEGVRLKIDQDGRIKNVSFPRNGQTITCAF